MCLYHPERLFHAAQYFSEKVCANGVTNLVTLAYCVAHYFSKRCERARKTLNIIVLASAAGFVFRHVRPGRNHTRRRISDTAKLDRALGNKVDVVFDIVVHLIEELMQRDKVRPLYIPVRVFAMQLQINRLCEA